LRFSSGFGVGGDEFFHFEPVEFLVDAFDVAVGDDFFFYEFDQVLVDDAALALLEVFPVLLRVYRLDFLT
jgi:hypothetical protein